MYMEGTLQICFIGKHTKKYAKEIYPVSILFKKVREE